MYRIDDSRFVLSPIATVVTDKWLNAVQESICKVIEAASIKIPLQADYTEANYSLLAEAINKLTRFQEKVTNVTIPLTKFGVSDVNYNNFKMSLLQFSVSIESLDKQIISWDSFQLLICKCKGKLTAQKGQRLSDGERYDFNFEFNSAGKLLCTAVPPIGGTGVSGTIIIRTLEER